MRPSISLAIPFLFALSVSAQAAGSSSDAPPKTTKTTTECTNGQIYDDNAKACVDADQQSLNDDQRYDAVRELAYAGEYDRAQQVIASADEPEGPRFLNYKGFISRKMGNHGDAIVFYSAALEKDPDYHLARSYMGQGLVATGDVEGAKAQLQEIRARGGRETWAYVSLKNAISGGPSSNY